MDDKPTTKTGNNTSSIRDDKGRWKSGVSGNPGGRPRGPSIAAILQRMGREVGFDEQFGEGERYELLAQRIWEGGLSGDKFCIDLLINRCDGPLKQVVEQTGAITADDLKGKRIVIEQAIVEADGAAVN